MNERKTGTRNSEEHTHTHTHVDTYGELLLERSIEQK